MHKKDKKWPLRKNLKCYRYKKLGEEAEIVKTHKRHVRFQRNNEQSKLGMYKRYNLKGWHQTNKALMMMMMITIKQWWYAEFDQVIKYLLSSQILCIYLKLAYNQMSKKTW